MTQAKGNSIRPLASKLDKRSKAEETFSSLDKNQLQLACLFQSDPS